MSTVVEIERGGHVARAMPIKHVNRVERGYGVYQLFDGDGDLLYVGRTVNLRARIGQHRGTLPCWQEVRFVSWTPCESYGESVALERLAICTDPGLANDTGRVDLFKIHARQTLPAAAAHRLRETYALDDDPVMREAASSYMRALHEAGWALQAIAAPLNITRERVRQRIASAAHDLDLAVPRPATKSEPFKSRGRMPSLAEQAELRKLYELGARLRGTHPENHPFRVAAERLSEMLAEQVMSGVSISNLAGLLGVKWQTVDKRLKRYGWMRNSPSQPDYGVVVHPNRPDHAGPRANRCKRGHDLAGDNLRLVNGDPSRRICRTCDRIRVATYQAKHGRVRDGESGAIREWARSQGFKVAQRGRIPAAVQEAYRMRLAAS